VYMPNRGEESRFSAYRPKLSPSIARKASDSSMLEGSLRPRRDGGLMVPARMGLGSRQG